MPVKKPQLRADARPSVPARERVIDVKSKTSSTLIRPALPAARTVAPARVVAPARTARPVIIKASGVSMTPGKPQPVLRTPAKARPPVSPGIGSAGGAPGLGMPFFVTAASTITPGSTVSPNIQSLRVPNGSGLLIEEIRFEVANLLEDGNPSNGIGSMNLGPLIGCQLKLGDQPLTSGFIPVGMFGPTLSMVSEYQTITSVGYLNQFSWRPPVPIFVPPGMILEPTFTNLGLFNATLRVRISYSGLVAAGPSRGVLPYVAQWSPDAFSANGTEVTRESSENDLVNPFDVPLHVSYLLGRIYGLYQLVASSALYVAEGTIDQGIADFSNIPQFTTLKMTASWGTPIVRDFVAWPQVFDPWSRKLEVPHEMPSESYHLVELRGGSEAVGNDGQGVPRITMVGWREVSP